MRWANSSGVNCGLTAPVKLATCPLASFANHSRLVMAYHHPFSLDNEGPRAYHSVSITVSKVNTVTTIVTTRRIDDAEEANRGGAEEPDYH